MLTWLFTAKVFGVGTDGFHDTVETNSARFTVQSYAVEGKIALDTNSLATLLAKHTGTNVGLVEITDAAADVQMECQRQGFANVSVAISQKRITNGTVPMYLFKGGEPQIVISGRRYYSLQNNSLAQAHEAVASATNSVPAPKPTPKFVINSYLVSGNSLLSPQTIKRVVFPHMGTNVTVDEILKAGSELQQEYRERGYPTVGVTIPPQQITNGQVKLRVFEGRLAAIRISHNHYFESNNIMRALPSLHTNIILNGPVFQAELNRANANQDRQIYPKIGPGPEENTTVLDLEVKDRLPLHGKMELNNENSPGTSALRLNSSAVYGNLWQLEHSLGVQYNFSPERYKTGDNWAFYDLPMVANYSGFYRMPLLAPESMEELVEANPGSFGFSEATRKFNLPPPSGQPEINFYASRATIDSGLITTPLSLGSPPANAGPTGTNSAQPTFSSTAEQQDLTVNEDLGFRLTVPLRGTEDFQSSFSGGLDYKNYDILSNKTNAFTLSFVTLDSQNNPTTQNEAGVSPVPITHNHLNYLPFSTRYDASLRDSLGITSFGLGLNGNFWHSGDRRMVQSMTGSASSSGRWLAINPSIARDFNWRTNWTLTLRGDGQWASQPLINNEQFGAGGVNSVRGYHEGEVFGDNGWHVSLEQKTPPFIVGFATAKAPLTVRGSVYMDYAEVYLIDPQGRPNNLALWGLGTGAVATLGPHWEARFLFSVPLKSTSTVNAFDMYFNFALNAQF